MYSVFYTQKAESDIPKLKGANLDKKAKMLLELVKKNPFASPPFFEKLQGDLSGAYSRRINRQHRLVYKVMEDEKAIIILSLWTYYEF